MFNGYPGHHVECELARLAAKHRCDCRSEGDLVAPGHLRHLVSVGGATEKAQQGHVINLAKLLAIQMQPLADAEGDETGPKRLLHRPAHPEVGGQGQRGHEFSQSHIPARPNNLSAHHSGQDDTPAVSVEPRMESVDIKRIALSPEPATQQRRLHGPCPPAGHPPGRRRRGSNARRGRHSNPRASPDLSWVPGWLSY